VHWIPYEDICIDECMMLYKGRYSARQHIRGKPNSTGLKFFVAADRTGFPRSFWLYEGMDKQKHIKSILLQKPRSAKTKDVVFDFVDDATSYDHRYIFDNYFSSLETGMELNKRNVRFISTIRSDRPTALFSQISKHLKVQGDYYSLRHKSGLLAVGHYDSKPCYFLTNDTGVYPLGPERKTQAGKKARQRPGTSEVYNLTMGGVDTFDNSFNRYLYAHKKMKFTRCLIYNLHKMALTTTWMIQKTIRDCTQRDLLIEYLLTNKPPGVQYNPNIKHLAVRGTRERRCEFCKRNSKDLKTNTYCTSCNVPLHIQNRKGENCFEKYHEDSF
jgi:hypothetical protein